MQTIMITLVGGRIPPIVAIAAKHYKNLTDVYFIVSRNSSTTLQQLLSIFKKEFPRIRLHNIDKNMQSNFVDPFDKGTIQQKLKIIAKQLEPGTRVVLQLTSGTQIMCIAAYEFAKEHDWSAIYVNTAGGTVHDLVNNTNETISSKVDVRFFSACYGFDIATDFFLKDSSVKKHSVIVLSNLIAEKINKFSKFIRRISIVHTKEKGLTFSNKETRECPAEIWNKLLELNMLRISGNDVCLDNVTWQFLNGKWLEVFVYNHAIQSLFFDDVQLSVQLDNQSLYTKTEADCDVFCIKSGIPLIIECKTGGKVALGDIKKIAQVAQKLGGNYCIRALVHTGAPTITVDEQKSKYRVECISILQLADNRNFLKNVFLKWQKTLL